MATIVKFANTDCVLIPFSLFLFAPLIFGQHIFGCGSQFAKTIPAINLYHHLFFNHSFSIKKNRLNISWIIKMTMKSIAQSSEGCQVGVTFDLWVLCKFILSSPSDYAHLVILSLLLERKGMSPRAAGLLDKEEAYCWTSFETSAWAIIFKR